MIESQIFTSMDLISFPKGQEKNDLISSYYIYSHIAKFRCSSYRFFAFPNFSIAN